VHTPDTQVSLVVQGFPSSQEPVLVGLLQTPVVGSQVPAEWHWSLATQVLAVPVQTPDTQVSPVVQASPSSHDPLLVGLLQTPVVGSQVPAEWHWSLALQVFAAPPTQTPDTQVSPLVHALPSSHEPVFTGLLHAPVVVSQVPAEWH
jgi:hypothetical protein